MQKQRPTWLVWLLFSIGIAAVLAGLICLGIGVFYYEFERLWKAGLILAICGGIWLLGLAYGLEHSIPWGSSNRKDGDRQ